MKRLIVVAAALALAACGLTPAPLPGPTPAGPIAEAVAKADTVVLTGERAFAVAELAYTTAAEGARLAIRNGGITGSNAAWVRDRNIEVRGWLVKGKATANAAKKARLAAQIFGVTARLNTLTGSK